MVTLDLDLAGEDGLALGRQLLDRWPDLTSQVQVKGHHVNLGVQEQLQGLRR